MKISITNDTFTTRYGIEDGCRRIRESGFEAIDWNLAVWNSAYHKKHDGQVPANIFDKDMDEIMEYYQPMLDTLKANDLEIGQAHAAFNAWDRRNPDLLDYAIEVYKKNILLCDKVGCKYLVIHGIKALSTTGGPGEEEGERLNRKLYESLIPTLQQTNVTICMENLFSGGNNYFIGTHCANPLEAVAFIDQLNAKADKECFGLCFDVGHLFLARVDVRYYISKLGKRIKVLHLHDNCGTDDSHMIPYTGRIPWAWVLEELKKVGYRGNISFETGNSFKSGFLPEELFMEFARHNAEIGKYFRKYILE